MSAITPPTAGSAEERLDAVAAERFDALPVTLPGAAWSPQGVDAAYLAVLAWAHSVDEWNPGWDAPARRGAIAASVAAHRLKGTSAGVKGMLDRIGAIYDYTERPDGAAFTAAVTIRNAGALRKSDAVSVRQLVDAYKRGTVHMQINFEAAVPLDVPIAGALGAVVVADLVLEAGT